MTKSVYNEINFGFLCLEVWTTEDGIDCARFKHEKSRKQGVIKCTGGK